MNTSFDLSQFKLIQAALEIRYDNAYLLWDRAGQIWSTANSKWDVLEVKAAEPTTTSFIAQERYDISVQLSKAYIIDLLPKTSLKDFTDNADFFVTTVEQILEVSVYNRLGLRLIYSRKFDSKAATADALMSLNIMHAPSGKFFNIDGRARAPKYSLIWQGESTATRINLIAQEKKIDLEVAPGIDEIETIHTKRHDLVFDIDYYTLKNVSKGQLNITDWISQTHHLIKRDSSKFLESGSG